MHKVTKDAFTLLLFSAVAGVAGYLYYFILARVLSVEEYGLLYSIGSLLYILTVPQETIRTVVAIFTTKYSSKKETGKIHQLMDFASKKIFLLSIVFFIIVLALTPLLISVLHTTFLPLAIISLLLLVAFLQPVGWGVFQGLGRFKELGINNSIETLIKLGLAVALVFLLPINIRIFGALIAAPISAFLALLLGFWALKDIKKAKKIKIKEKLGRYSFATLIIFGLITLMYSVDVIIARYFFSARVSGIYGGISLICKSLFFIATGIKRAMMPNLVKKNEEKQDKEVKSILKKVSLLMIMLFGGFLILSIFFPNQIVMVVLGKKFLSAAPYLKYMVMAMAFFSFANLMVYYNLSINQNKKMTIRVLASAFFLEVVLLLFFHETIQQFIQMMMIVNLALLIGLVVISLIKPKENKPIRLLKK
ncbi:MAG: oligosaccharide flippase family protein [Candidatus Pacearchaeota archaeon]|nr:oligosaccharide flippase family protein [Candidatus Pacearchaeota archaeon]